MNYSCLGGLVLHSFMKLQHEEVFLTVVAFAACSSVCDASAGHRIEREQNLSCESSASQFARTEVDWG